MADALKTRASDEIAPECLADSGRAVADLAHLAKNIIQVMSGCSEIIDLALNTNQLDRVQKAWKLYQPSFWRLKKLQLDLIKYTKSYPLTLQPCDVNVPIAAAAKQMEPFFEKRSVRFSSHLANNLPSITADGEKLRDTVVNLLVTAVDNLQDEPGQLSISTSLMESGNAVRITVCDSGPHLDADACCALLTPHERCRNMLGTGLEIPLAKQVIENHGGGLNLNTDQTETNTFEIILPAIAQSNSSNFKD